MRHASSPTVACISTVSGQTAAPRHATSCHASPRAPISHGFIENTLPSMAEAFRLGADVVEIDVHLTPDGAYAVNHDWTLDCRTDGTGKTHEHSMEYLRQLDVGYRLDDGSGTYPLRGAGLGMKPTLSQVFTAALDGPFLINFIPGGDSALGLANDVQMMDWLRATSDRAERVLAVCAGTVLLAMTGVLDGRKATTNKLDFKATVPLAPMVEWVEQAPWVEDGKFFTSSGVSAGMDTALAMVQSLFGTDAAQDMAEGTEYIWNRDPNNDPFVFQVG